MLPLFLVLALSFPVLLLPGATPGPLHTGSPTLSTAPADTVWVILGEIQHMAVPEGPRETGALRDSVIALLNAGPTVRVVDRGAHYMVFASLSEVPGGRALLDTRLVLMEDRTMLGRRGIEVTVGPEAPPLAPRIAGEILGLVHDLAPPSTN